MRNVLACVAVVLCTVLPALAQRAPSPPSFGVPSEGAMVGEFAVPGALDTSVIQATSTISNPTTVTFTASPDHGATDLGQPVLTNYVFEVTKDGATTTAGTANIGKPTPVSNQITFTWPDALRTTVGAGVFTARVRAVGPAGSAVSAPTPPFDFSPRAPSAPGTPVLK